MGGQTVDANRRLLKHLGKERNNLFTFLKQRDVEATNWKSEHAIRPIVVTRKVFGGNHSLPGARVQKIVCTFLRTCWQQERDPIPLLTELPCSPDETVSVIVAGTQTALPSDRGP